MTPLKYLNDWFGQIFKKIPDDECKLPEDVIIQRQSSTKIELTVKVIRDHYCRTIYVTKTELGT